MSTFEDIDICEIQEGLLRNLKNREEEHTNDSGKRVANSKGRLVKKRKKTKHKGEQCSDIQQICDKNVKTSGSQSGTIENVVTNHHRLLDIDTEDPHDESLDERMGEDSESEIDLSSDKCEGGKRVKNEKKYLEQLKSQLSLTDDDFLKFEKFRKKEKKEVKTVITAAGKPKREPEIIVFEDPAKKKEKRNSLQSAELTLRKRHEPEDWEERNSETFNMRHAKFDVHQFAVRGMAKEDKESAQIAHAIKLGAKPKKRAYVNYKQLLEVKKKEKERDEERITMEKSMGYKSSSVFSKTMVSGSKRKKRWPFEGHYAEYSCLDKCAKNRPNDMLTRDGQIGRYKEGIQFISHKQIESIKGNTLSHR